VGGRRAGHHYGEQPAEHTTYISLHHLFSLATPLELAFSVQRLAYPLSGPARATGGVCTAGIICRTSLFTASENGSKIEFIPLFFVFGNFEFEISNLRFQIQKPVFFERSR